MICGYASENTVLCCVNSSHNSDIIITGGAGNVELIRGIEVYEGRWVGGIIPAKSQKSGCTLLSLSWEIFQGCRLVCSFVQTRPFSQNTHTHTHTHTLTHTYAHTHTRTHTQFQQIVKILNAHTDSLGWIDRETALLRQKVDDVAKVTEYRKREQERSFRLVS